MPNPSRWEYNPNHNIFLTSKQAVRKDKFSLKTITKILAFLMLAISILLTSGCSQASEIEVPVTSVSTPTEMVPTRLPSETPTTTPFIVQGTLRIWHAWNEIEVPVLDQIINEFSAQYPNVYFDVLYIPIENLRARFEMEAAEGRGPDILLGPAEWGPGLYESGYLANLNDLVDEQVLQMINQPSLDASRVNNELIGLPYSLRGTVLFRNKNIIPDSAVTFDQLVYNANAATKGDQIGAMLDRSLLYGGAHLEGIGGKMMDEDGLPAFNNEFGLQWIELLQRYEEAGPADYFSDQEVDLFKQGKIGIIVEGSWREREISQAIGAENLSVDSWPQYDEGHLSGYVLPENLYLNNSTSGERLNAARNFMAHFVSKDSQTRIAEMGQVPSIQDVVLTDPITGTLMTKTITAMSDGTAYPVIPEWEIYQLSLDIALRSIFSGQITPAEALQTAEDEIVKGLLEKDAPPSTTLTPTP